MNNYPIPSLLVFRERCKYNIQKFKSKALKNKIIFRPHFKTHQNIFVAELFKKSGIDKISVSSVEMAEKFIDAGFKDICIAFTVNRLQLVDYKRLSEKIKLSLVVEDIETLNLIDFKSDIYIKTDTSYNRTGISVEKHYEILDLKKHIDKKDNLNFIGFLSHFGDTYNANSIDEILDIYDKSVKKLNKLKTIISGKALISVGDTPSLSIIDDLSDVDEIRPGNFIYYDYMQLKLGSCNLNEVSAIVSCPVVAKHKERNEIVIYGGAVHLSKEYIIENNEKVFGKLIRILNSGEFEIIKNTRIDRLSQEHGIIKTDRDYFDEVETGSNVFIIPVHSCLTANLLKNNTFII